MAETVRCVLFITLTIAFIGSAADKAKTIDSVPAAITVYRNPEFFRNLTNRRENLENEEEEEEEDKGNAYSDDFYDFDDEYRYPGEPKKPNPPASPDFITYFDESPEFQPEPREISPPRGGNLEEEQSEEANDENEFSDEGGLRSTTSSYDGEDRESERETSEEENGDRESTEQREETDVDGHQEEERSEEADEEKEELNEEEEDSESSEDEPEKKDKYHVPMDKDLRMKVPAKVYEESKEYFNPVLNAGIAAYHYPSTYEDLDYYSYEEDDRMKPIVDNKKGTREYLKDHSIEEIEDARNPRDIRSGSKQIFRTVSKFGIKAIKPYLYVPRISAIKKKILHKPKYYYKWRHHFREVPDDSVYQLSSDYDSDFEFF